MLGPQLAWLMTNEDSQDILQQLIADRKSLAGSEKARGCQLNKPIQQQIRLRKDEQRAAQIDNILNDFSNIRALKAI